MSSVPDPRILEKLQKRAALRIERDAQDLPPRDPTPITYAYGLRTGRFYAGYSGANGLIRPKRSADGPMATKPYEKLRDDIDAVKAGEKNVYSCSEAAARAIAVKQGENLGDVVFASFGLSGESVSPCDICKVWLQSAYRLL